MTPPNVNEIVPLMVPFNTMISWQELGLTPAVVFGRPATDFAADCLLYKIGKAILNSRDISRLKAQGSLICYSYERLDFDNREFTIDGHRAIVQDMQTAISSGFTHSIWHFLT